MMRFQGKIRRELQRRLGADNVQTGPGMIYVRIDGRDHALHCSVEPTGRRVRIQESTTLFLDSDDRYNAQKIADNVIFLCGLDQQTEAAERPTL